MIRELAPSDDLELKEVSTTAAPSEDSKLHEVMYRCLLGNFVNCVRMSHCRELRSIAKLGGRFPRRDYTEAESEGIMCSYV